MRKEKEKNGGGGKKKKTLLRKPLQGRLLVSEPFLGDFYFKRSVILLADYNKDGSYGVILNKPIGVKVSDVLKDFPGLDIHLHLGGPVNVDSIFYLHTFGDEIKDSLKIMDGIYWGGDFERIKELALEKKLNDSNIRFFIGYSGWASSQLDQELKEKSWIITSTEPREIFGRRIDGLWKDTLQKMPQDYAMWINYPADPSLN
ncbi:MAG: YqgE/AlgH family protein [Bacteroidetes bacterium]|nr:YqgE/AlgH family protein [Bacteroidota bacterium]MBU1720984.1 YqgE/AlgH family protein [Bacteroidota bacterium]